MVWVGLIQAYLLMTIIAVLLILGAGQVDTRKWHVVGALAHGPPLIAALSSLDVSRQWGCSELSGCRLRSMSSFSVLKRSQHFLLTSDNGVRKLLSSLGDSLGVAMDCSDRFRVE